ncbi:MAG TPA: PEP-CTERM sorting domain-containing protein [Burkholderiales bacterium]|nr:PEP-CTERM sorting domain-containing protein [Burkholderiales bacterium]
MDRKTIQSALVLIGLVCGTGSAFAQTPVATWDFNNTLNANQSGAPALTAIDPLGQNSFVTDTVFGLTRTVYQYSGTQFPPSLQAGLSVNTTGLLTHGNLYSVDMVFKIDASQSTWKNIFGVSNRTSDNAFYVEPGNKLQIYPTGNGTTNFTFGEYHHVTLTNNGAGHVTSYLDGAFQFDLTTTVMDFSTYASANPDRLITFFADNLVGGGIGEFSNGHVASISLYNSELTRVEVADVSKPVPEPSEYVLMLAGLGLVGFMARRKARKAA